MAPTKNKTSKPPRIIELNKQQQTQNQIWNQFNLKQLQKCIFDPSAIHLTCYLLFAFEVLLNIFIIERVNYTEIDWNAYMQEVEGVINGTLDYSQLKGDTGPLVYPAGFVYIYTIFYYLTAHGQNIHLAQYIFMLIYLAQNLLIYRIYVKTAKIPPYALILTTLTSYRIHSIYVLRLFNDPISVLFFYIALNLFISSYWKWGSLFFSIAVSVKMNILLYAPVLLLAYLTNLTLLQTFFNLAICALTQLILGAPFLLTYPIAYIRGSFDLGRIFDHKWTVNYRFLPREMFENRTFHFALLICHILLLLLFLPKFRTYLTSYAKLLQVTDDIKLQIHQERQKRREERIKANANFNETEAKFINMFEQQLKSKYKQQQSNVDQLFDDDDSSEQAQEENKLEKQMSKIVQLFILPFFVANFIGMACARSLHYQFYSWYFHSLLYLVFSTNFTKPAMFLLLALIEYCWNVYPSTEFSSGLLHCCHFVILVGLYRNMSK